MRKSGKLGVAIMGGTVLIAMVLSGVFYPMGAPPSPPRRSSSTAPATNFGPNAADSYREAIALLQALRSDPSQRDQLDRYEEGRFDDGAGAFFAKYEEIVAEVKAGAMVEQCNWGEPQMGERMTSLNGLRGIANFTLLHASHVRSEPDTALMLDDVLAAMALARHVGRDGLLVDKLVEVAVEIKAINQLAAALLMLSPEQLEFLRRRLDALPKSISGKEVMEGELQFARRSMSQRGLLTRLLADGLEDFHKELGAVIDQQSPAEFTRTVNALLARSGNQLTQITAPSIARAREPMAVLQAKRAMLRTAIEIRLNGEPVIVQSRDPFGDGPFGYVKTSTGFELTSKLPQRNVPVSLIVGGQ